MLPTQNFAIVISSGNPFLTLRKLQVKPCFEYPRRQNLYIYIKPICSGLFRRLGATRLAVSEPLSDWDVNQFYGQGMVITMKELA